jgi:hypothetical protein
MKHWTEIDFQNWLYGLRDEDRHFEECAECRAERDRLAVERRRILAEPEVSTDFLAAQRRSIYRRMAEPMRNWVPMRWALSVTMLLVMVFSFTLTHSKKPNPMISDEQLFTELSSMDQSSEPKAIAPIHKLFEE